MDQLTNTFRCWQSFLFSEPRAQLRGSKQLHFIAENDLEPMFSLHSTCSSFLKQKFPEQAATEAGKGRQAEIKIQHAKSQMQIREKTAVFGLQPSFFGIQCQMGI